MLGGIHAFSINLNNRMICGVKVINSRSEQEHTVCNGSRRERTRSTECAVWKDVSLNLSIAQQVLETIFILESRAASKRGLSKRKASKSYYSEKDS